MAAEEAADTENGTETRKEEAENGAETPEGGEAGRKIPRIRKRRLLRRALTARKRQRPGRTPVRRKEKPRKARKLLSGQPSGRALRPGRDSFRRER